MSEPMTDADYNTMRAMAGLYPVKLTSAQLSALLARLDAITAERDALLAANEAATDALKTAASWLELHARHIGTCARGMACTCGLTRVRFEVESAPLPAAPKSEA